MIDGEKQDAYLTHFKVGKVKFQIGFQLEKSS